MRLGQGIEIKLALDNQWRSTNGNCRVLRDRLLVEFNRFSAQRLTLFDGTFCLGPFHQEVALRDREVWSRRTEPAAGLQHRLRSLKQSTGCISIR